MTQTPETTNLQPMTYAAAMELYTSNGRRPFSFVAAPYGVLKTVMRLNGHVVAAPPAAAQGVAR